MKLFFLIFLSLVNLLTFCATKKNHLLFYLRKRAKQHQESTWFSQTNFYEANKKEIHSLARIIARERYRERKRILRENEFNRLHPIITEDESISPRAVNDLFNINNPFSTAFTEIDNPWEVE